MAIDNDEDLELMKDVIYRPCKFCGSYNYDVVHSYDERLLEEEGIFQPEVCDCCAQGAVRGGTVTIH